MININGTDWLALESNDILAMLSEVDVDESFYFEFKDDKVTTKKLMEEVSALANTFGGYIFIGISDDKQIEGCTNWNEQRIHTTIHDSITPTPSFDVKKFTCNSRTVYVIKIDEGAEPPYITNSGKIYERLSSGSFAIKDSARLSQIYNKREQQLAKFEKKISIPPISEKANNIYGYIDTGFALVLSDTHSALDVFDKVDLKSIAKKIVGKMDGFNLAYVGNSIVFTPGGLSTKSNILPAHTNNFLEIMADGSARMRILLLSNNQDDLTVNMMYAAVLLKLFKEVYTYIFKEIFPDKMAYAKKYESLTIRKQFNPTLFYDSATLELLPEFREKNEKMISATKIHQELVGIDTVVTDDRIPKTGLYTIDKRQMEKWNEEYTAQSIIDELFFSKFVSLGVTPTMTDDEMQDD